MRGDVLAGSAAAGVPCVLTVPAARSDRDATRSGKLASSIHQRAPCRAGNTTQSGRVFGGERVTGTHRSLGRRSCTIAPCMLGRESARATAVARQRRAARRAVTFGNWDSSVYCVLLGSGLFPCEWMTHAWSCSRSTHFSLFFLAATCCSYHHSVYQPIFFLIPLSGHRQLVPRVLWPLCFARQSTFSRICSIRLPLD